MILEFRNICKSFGDKEVLKNISFTAKSGVANAYLGRNGSGKTTTFRILLDIFKADKGEVLLNGEPIDYSKIKIGYLPEERGMYDDVGLVDQLVYFAMLKGMNKKEAKESALHWLKIFDLEDDKKKLKTLSKGNAQKIQIIQCVINDPDILVLDEPFSGLDPVNAGKLKEIIKDFIKRDKLVIFSSHQMPVVETFCEDINIIDKGLVVLSGNLETIKKERSKNKMLLKVDNINIEKLIEKITSLDKNIEFFVENDSIIFNFKNENEQKEVITYLLNNNINIEEFRLYKPSLEEIFVEIAGDKDE